MALGGANREYVFKTEVGIHVHLEFVLKMYISFPISMSTEFSTVIAGVHWNPQGAFRITLHPHPIVGTLLSTRSWTFVFAAATLECFQLHAPPETISADLLPVYPWGPLKLCSRFDSSLSMVSPQQGLFNFLTLKMMCTRVGLCMWVQGSVEARAGGRSQMPWSWSSRDGESPDMGACLNSNPLQE